MKIAQLPDYPVPTRLFVKAINANVGNGRDELSLLKGDCTLVMRGVRYECISALLEFPGIIGR